ncbi:dual specificity protein phosphatase family protein [Halobium salinum]|uniref:Dual specificity protein phosphatase family protein n=1 Tax=Halobium salinum TaxID=1364940 RepID=A0ABD5PCL1_9EURY|nr:dual specificity protein phosphatase [Halobium salinum]
MVRPFGYVEDHPVVRRIGDRDLYLGNAHAADPERCGGVDFEHVLTLTDTRSGTTHHHPLVDGEGTEWPAFEAAVDTARDLHRKEGTLLVHCKAGISRSSTVLATLLAAEEGTNFADALAEVQRARPHATPNPALVELAVCYLAAGA